jgi:predicted amidohydrolase
MKIPSVTSHLWKLCSLLILSAPSLLASTLPEGWIEAAPRAEIRPQFTYDEESAVLTITHDSRKGLDGWFQKTFAVKCSDFVKFSALRKTFTVENPRHSGLARIVWMDEKGGKVASPSPGASAEPEHPGDGLTDGLGWTSVSGIYRVPPKAVQAVVELHLQHAPNGRVDWRAVEFTPTAEPASRKVRLATVQYMPSGKSPRANCEEYAPLVTEAARQKADLVVLGETVPYVRTKLTPEESAEPVPGPTTEYFGRIAEENHIHIVLSLYERDAHLIYNTAVLLGPSGKLIGKYRKVCLPHGEVEKGVAPGSEYPVFDTALGKVGLMICYDGFYPEVAGTLSANGAEIIAWPVWGCDPLLARARACENRVHLVSSTFTDPKQDWMISAVYAPSGKPIAQARENRSVAVAEVDLAQPLVGPYNLGSFREIIQRHRPRQ